MCNPSISKITFALTSYIEALLLSGIGLAGKLSCLVLFEIQILTQNELNRRFLLCLKNTKVSGLLCFSLVMPM